MIASAADSKRQWGPLLGAVVLLHPSSLSLALEAPALLTGALFYAWANCGSQSSGEARRVAVSGLGTALVAVHSALAATVLLLAPLLIAIQARQAGALRRAALMAVPVLASVALSSPPKELPQIALESTRLFLWVAGPMLFLPCILFFRVRQSPHLQAHHWAGGMALWLSGLVLMASGPGQFVLAGLLSPWIAFAFAPSARAPHIQSLCAASVTACGALVLVTGVAPITPTANAHAVFVVPVARMSALQSVPQGFWSPGPMGITADNPPAPRTVAEVAPLDDLQDTTAEFEPVKPFPERGQTVRLASALAGAVADWPSDAPSAGRGDALPAAAPGVLRAILALTLDESPEVIPDLSFRRIDGLEEVNARAPLAALAVWNKYEVSAGIAVDEDIYVQAWGARVTTGPFGDESVEAGFTATIRF